LAGRATTVPVPVLSGQSDQWGGIRVDTSTSSGDSSLVEEGSLTRVGSRGRSGGRGSGGSLVSLDGSLGGSGGGGGGDDLQGGGGRLLDVGDGGQGRLGGSGDLSDDAGDRGSLLRVIALGGRVGSGSGSVGSSDGSGGRDTVGSTSSVQGLAGQHGATAVDEELVLGGTVPVARTSDGQVPGVVGLEESKGGKYDEYECTTRRHDAHGVRLQVPGSVVGRDGVGPLDGGSRDGASESGEDDNGLGEHFI
jgi:hypothetical protein